MGGMGYIAADLAYGSILRVRASYVSALRKEALYGDHEERPTGRNPPGGRLRKDPLLLHGPAATLFGVVDRQVSATMPALSCNLGSGSARRRPSK